MSSTSSCSESTFDSSDLETNYSSEYELEAEHEEVSRINSEESPMAIRSVDEEVAALYADDPIADAEWSARYEEEIEETEELERKLKDRLDGIVELNEWCKCGNCSVQSLQNVSECYCCSELEGCLESMKSVLVLQDLPKGVKLTCITEHPGFNPVCLQKWSLRLASWKYKTKGKHKYKQTGSEESFLRSVSYREFSRLVYGVLGNKRIPLPACAYTAIRKEFPISISKDETYTGFDLDEEN